MTARESVQKENAPRENIQNFTDSTYSNTTAALQTKGDVSVMRLTKNILK